MWATHTATPSSLTRMMQANPTQCTKYFQLGRFLLHYNLFLSVKPELKIKFNVCFGLLGQILFAPPLKTFLPPHVNPISSQFEWITFR